VTDATGNVVAAGGKGLGDAVTGITQGAGDTTKGENPALLMTYEMNSKRRGAEMGNNCRLTNVQRLVTLSAILPRQEERVWALSRRIRTRLVLSSRW
jgi:hypothetical protein